MAHLHGVIDMDKHFVIDAETREITNQSNKITLMQHDHNSERFTFELPKMVDGHDMSLCNLVQVHYINIDSSATRATNPGIYVVEDFEISPDDEEVVIGSWLISSNATKYAGNLNFILRFLCVAEDETVVYAWNTAPFTGISIGKGIDNTAAVTEKYADILAQWQARFEALEGGSGGEAPSTNNRIANVEILADKWEGTESPYSQVVSIEGITKNSQVNLTPSIEQLAIFYQKDLAFVTENDNGVVTVYAIGDKPANDYTIQATILEVSV